MIMRRYLPLVIFIIGYLLFAFTTYKDFGITWDENDFYTAGQDLYIHLVVPESPSVHELIFKTQGAEIKSAYNYIYSSTLYFFNKGLLYERYHLMNMLFALGMYILSYVVLLKKYSSGWIALLGPLTLIFIPRLFGHVPSNPKDVPFAVMYFISLSMIYLFSQHKNVLLKIIVFGFIFGITQNMRIVGLSIYGILFGYDLYTYSLEEQVSIRSFIEFMVYEVLYIGLITVVGMFITLATWPYIGSNSMKNFLQILDSSRSYPWIGQMLFDGKLVFSNKLPLRYLPTWLGITTPLLTIILALTSVLKGFRTNFKNPLVFIMTFSLIVNLSMYFLLRPIIYDGMRHFIFLLPMIGILAAVALIDILKKWRRISLGIILLMLLYWGNLAFTYMNLHPYEYTFFNSTVGGLHGAFEKYETDYWGASFREASIWLRDNVASKTNKTIVVHTCAQPIMSTYYFSENMQWSDNPAKAEYSICYTRNNNYKNLPGEVVFSVERDGIPLNVVKHNSNY